MSSSSSAAAVLMVAVVLAAVGNGMAAASANSADLDRYPGRGGRGGIPNKPPAKQPPPSVPRPTPPPPSPLPPLPFCDCACNCSQCNIDPNPPFMPGPQPLPGRAGTGSPFPRPPRPGGGISNGGGGRPAVGQGIECVAPLAAVMSCGAFVTGSQEQVPARTSACCAGLGAFAGAPPRILQCLCPVITGDVNRMLPKPVDPVRMLFLPIACGIVIPSTRVLSICFGDEPQQTPPLVVPDVWEKQTSAALSPP